MSSLQTVTFQEALDIVESLPEHQQEDLVNIIRARHLERRRELIAQNIEQARAEYARGEFNRGTVEDLMKEFNRGTVEDLMKELTEDRWVEDNEL